MHALNSLLIADERGVRGVYYLVWQGPGQGKEKELKHRCKYV